MTADQMYDYFKRNFGFTKQEVDIMMKYIVNLSTIDEKMSSFYLIFMINNSFTLFNCTDFRHNSETTKILTFKANLRF